MEIMIFVFLMMIFATGVGAVTSVLFDVALRYGLFGRAADGMPRRACKLCLSIVPISFVAAYAALFITPIFSHSAEWMLVVACFLTGLIVVGIKFTSMLCKSRQCQRRRAPRGPENSNTTEPTDVLRITLAPIA